MEIASLVNHCLKTYSVETFALLLRFPSTTINVQWIILTDAVPAVSTNKIPLTRLVKLDSVKHWLYLIAKLAMFLTQSHH